MIVRSIKTVVFLLVLTLIALFYYNHKHSYYGYTKSYFNQTPSYIRPNYNGPDLGNTGFNIVQNDIDLNVIGPYGKTRISNGERIHFKHLSGYYYTKDNLIVEGFDKNNINRLVLITPKNFESYVFNLLDSVPKDEGYEHVVIPKGKWTFYITNYLIILSFILGLLLLYFVIKERKRRKKI